MRKIVTLGALAVLFLSVPAFANFTTPTFNTIPDTSGNNNSGTAQFSFNSTTDILSITLNNTGTVAAIANLLTGVGWDFTGTGSVTGLGAPSTTNTAGYNCTGTGASTSCTSAATITPNAPWLSDVGTGTVGSYPYNITSFTNSPKGSAIANDTILTSGKDGLSTDTPYYKGPVTFTLSVSGTNLGSLTGVDNVFIAFGTLGGGLPTPEPGFYGALSLGLAGLFLARWRRRAA